MDQKQKKLKKVTRLELLYNFRNDFESRLLAHELNYQAAKRQEISAVDPRKRANVLNAIRNNSNEIKGVHMLLELVDKKIAEEEQKAGSSYIDPKILDLKIVKKIIKNEKPN